MATFYQFLVSVWILMKLSRLVHVFKNWKLLFENICWNTCWWKNVWKYVKCYLKTENCCLKTQTKHPLRIYSYVVDFLKSYSFIRLLFFFLIKLSIYFKSISIRCVKCQIFGIWHTKHQKTILIRCSKCQNIWHEWTVQSQIWKAYEQEW